MASVAAAHHLQLSGDGDIDNAHRLLVGAIEMQPEPYDAASDTMVEALYTLGWVCYFGGPRRAVGTVRPGARPADPGRARSAGPSVRDLWRPGSHGAARARADRRRRRGADRADRPGLGRPGRPGLHVRRPAGGLPRAALWRILRDGRDGRAVTLSLARAVPARPGPLHDRGMGCDRRRWPSEHVGLCRAHNYRLLECRGLYLQAMVAAARGDDAATRTLTDQMIRWAAPAGSGRFSGSRPGQDAVRAHPW